jgi:hypothetical protein
MYERDGTYRRREPAPQQMPYGAGRGIFMGNRTVRLGFVVVMFSMLYVLMFNRSMRQRLNGPIDDFFRRDPKNIIIVYSTEGDTQGYLKDYAQKVSALLGQKLSVKIMVYSDTEADKSLLKNHSVMLYGPVEHNQVAQEIKDYFPFKFSGQGVYLGDKYYNQQNWRLIFLIPNPYNKKYYFLVYTGPTIEDIVGINFQENPNFVNHDISDYVFAVESKVVEMGIFDKKDRNHWVVARKVQAF